ncbi:MAG: hypothetical protein IJ608_14570, partial [Lachnospiraceae bacterium]|nr:hypothetical protein [Lachnospiraceae bacterium]
MKAFRKLISILLVLAMTAALTAGCGKKSGDTSESSGGGLLCSVSDKLGGTEDGAEDGEGGEAGETAKPAEIPGHYDLWTYAAGGEYTAEIPHDELGMEGFVFLEKDHTGRMGQSFSCSESVDNEFTWDDDGNISMFGQNLYTFEVVGDILIVDMGQGAVKYYYVREGVNAEVAYANYKEGKGIKDAASLMADGSNGEDKGNIEVGSNNDVTYSQVPV